MATCTVKLYRQTKIEMDKNFYVENIEDYLASVLFPQTIQNYQYQKIELEMKIKVGTYDDIAEEIAAGKNISTNLLGYYFNYCSLQDTSDNKIYYYFIVNRKPLANGTIEYTLNMDTVNTYQVDLTDASSPDISFNKKTQIIRQHEDRFYQGRLNNKLVRKIHFYPEGLQPLLYKQTEQEINSDNRKWYIINNTASASGSTTVDTYYCADSAYNFYIYSDNILDAAGINALLNQGGSKNYKYLFFGEGFSGTLNTKIQIDDKIVNLQGKTWSIRKSLIETNKFTLQESRSNSYYYGGAGTTFSTLKILDSSVFKANSFDTAIYDKTSFSTILNAAKNVNIDPSLGNTLLTLNSVQDIDRTKNTLNKLIEVPYCPFNTIIIDGKNYLPDYLEVKDVPLASSGNIKMIHVKNTNIFESSASTITSNIKNKDFLFVSGSVSDTFRNDNLESKIYHSDFYYDKFIYDSFYTNLNYENLEDSGFDNDNLSFNFVCTKTLNSKFLFKINNFPLKYSTSDYDNIITVARNNDIPLLNSAYIDYIKNGYNYDVKNKERQELTRNLTTGLSIATTAVSIASAVFTSGATLPLVIASIAGTASTIANNINSSIQAEQGIEQKLNQLKNQSANVIGSDDIDLMRYYTNQKAKLVNYTVSEEMRKNLLDLFYYRGYLINKQGIPNCSSRRNFNFIQCDPVFNVNALNISQDAINNLKERYKLGVTVLHKFNDAWDFAQTSGNLETFLV